MSSVHILSAAEASRALIERQLAVLTRLADIGMEIAEAAGRRAAAWADGDAPAAAVDPGLTYARTARAVRLTIVLQSRLMNDFAALGRAEDLAAAERKSARRLRLRQLVERAVDAEHDAGTENRRDDEIEQRGWEARERLADAELDAELEGLPFAAVVARICEDLGLAPDLTARILAAAGPESDPENSPENDPVGAPRRWSRSDARRAEARPPGRVSQSASARPRAPPN